MKINHSLFLQVCCVVSVVLFAGIFPIAAQTNDEIKAEIERLKERKSLFDERDALKAEIEAREKGQKPTTPSGSSSPSPSPTPKVLTTVVNAAIESITSVPGVKELFSKSDNTVIKSVCEQVRLSPDDYSIYDKSVCQIANTLVESARFQNDRINVDHGEISNRLAILIAAKFAELPATNAMIDADVKKFILDAENKRNDKQVGGDSKSGGTTSLAVKGGVPQFLAWAVESGSAVGSRSGNTLTFRINPVGLLSNVSRATPLLEQNFASNFRSGDSFTESLKKLSLGFSFDITRGNETPLFTGSKQQLSAFSVRYNFLNRKDPRHPMYKAEWEKFRTDALAPYTEFANKLFGVLVNASGGRNVYKSSDIETWRSALEFRLREEIDPQGSSKIEVVEKVRQILVEEFAKFPFEKIKNDTEIVAIVNENGKKLITYSKARKELEEKIAKGEVLTLEYTNYREVNSPDLSNLRFIAEKGFGNEWNLSANASISFLNKIPTGSMAKRIRDFDFTLQLEKPLMQLPFGRPIFSFAGQWQRLPGNIIGPDGLLMPNTKGDTAVGQLKLVIPINGTGIKLPFSITFANRSELIKESTIRGNFGFTLDLDRLLLGKKLF